MFAAVATCLGAGAACASILAVDLYLHHRYQKTIGLNVWGYRGPAVGEKAPGETRVVVLGGSTAFGYGPGWHGSFPYLLERRLEERGRRCSVVNLGYISESAHSFRFTLEDYEYLDFDIAILYEGYNELIEYNDFAGAPQYQSYRRMSPVFRLTGYMPIFPVVFKDKAWAMLGARVAPEERDSKTVFRPGLATQATAMALEAAAVTAEALERQLGRLTRDVNDARMTAPTSDCAARWHHYCGAIDGAIEWVRSRGKSVLVGTQPYISDDHIDQQNALRGMLEQKYKADPGVRHVNLGRAVDLTNRRLAYDGMHLSAAGNEIIAAGFAAPVMEMAARSLR